MGYVKHIINIKRKIRIKVERFLSRVGSSMLRQHPRLQLPLIYSPSAACLFTFHFLLDITVGRNLCMYSAKETHHLNTHWQ